MKIFLITLLAIVFSGSISAQKNKKATTKPAANKALAKVDNLSVELVKNSLYLFANDGKSKDTLSSKTTDNPVSDVKIVTFTAKGSKLYSMTWTEKVVTTTATKTEEKTLANTEIFDLSSKTKVFANMQTSTKIKEQVFLDRLKNASETQERTRNEGFVVTILPDGDLSLKTKTQENKMTFDAAAKKYVDVKKKK